MLLSEKSITFQDLFEQREPLLRSFFLSFFLSEALSLFLTVYTNFKVGFQNRSSFFLYVSLDISVILIIGKRMYA